MSENGGTVCPMCGRPMEDGSMSKADPMADAVSFVYDMLEKHVGLRREWDQSDWRYQAVRLWEASGRDGRILVQALREAAQDSDERSIIFKSPGSFVGYAISERAKAERRLRREETFLGGNSE